MPSSSYMPDKVADQVLWANTFNTVVSGAVAAYGVPAGLMAAFGDVNTALQEAWQASELPSTRTKGTIATRNNALKLMRETAKNLVSIIQGTPAVTDEMKIAAGVTVRKTHGSPIGVPTQSPFIKVKSINGRQVTVQLQQDVSKRCKPPGVAGATILSATTATESTDRWKFLRNTTRPGTVTITFPASSTGDTVYLSAFWWNERGESGPAANPLAINLPAGGVVMDEESNMPALKAA